MKYLILLFALILLILASCSRDNRLKDYDQIVENADKIIFYSRIADTFAISRSVDSLKYLQNLKGILKRHIEPEPERKFVASNKIEF
jgi:hypothetical protein